MRASLLLILSEQNYVLAFRIVPNDSRDFISTLLEEIWLTERIDGVHTLVVYTDNSNVDKKSIKEAYKKFFPENNIPIHVLLVSFCTL